MVTLAIGILNCSFQFGAILSAGSVTDHQLSLMIASFQEAGLFLKCLCGEISVILGAFDFLLES